MVSVDEYAKQRGISPQRVRELLRNGQLPGRRVGKAQWEIEEAAYSNRSHHGRPMSDRMAWALIRALSGDNPPPSIAPSERSRIRNRIAHLRDADDPAAVLSSWLRARGSREVYAIAPQDLPELIEDPRVLPSGISDPRAGISAADKAELWIREANQARNLIMDYLLIPDPNGQVVLHSGPDMPEHVAPIGLVLADLADWNSPRENGKVAEILRAV